MEEFLKGARVDSPKPTHGPQLLGKGRDREVIAVADWAGGPSDGVIYRNCDLASLAHHNKNQVPQDGCRRGDHDGEAGSQ